MNQAEKRAFLIKRLLNEDRRYRGMEIPADAYAQKRMLRSLMNIRRPQAIDAEFLTVQDEYLRQEIKDAGITRLADLEPVCGDFYLWQGDITRLQCGAIVNAANSGMTAAMCRATPASTTASIPLRAYNSDWTALSLWNARVMKSLPGRPKVPRLTICPATMCCTPSAPLSMAV